MDAPFPLGMVEEIAEFLAKDAERESGRTIYPEVFASNLFFPLQRQAEMVEMLLTAKTREPKAVMEIGADKGGSLYHWCKCLPSVQRVIACEIRGTPYKQHFEQAFPHIAFQWVEGPSLPVQVAGPLDVLFIDGDKRLFAEDFDAYRPLMSDSGLVFMHDINERGGPRNAFERCKKLGYQCREIIDTSDYDLADGNTPHEGWLRHWRGRSCGVGVVYMEGGPRCAQL